VVVKVAEIYVNGNFVTMISSMCGVAKLQAEGCLKTISLVLSMLMSSLLLAGTTVLHEVGLFSR